MQQVGRYQIMEKLGRGGMATVFRARDPDIGRDVAIKFLHASLCEDAEYRARFLQEARSAGQRGNGESDPVFCSAKTLVQVVSLPVQPKNA